MDAITTIQKRLALFESWYGFSSAEMSTRVQAGKLAIEDRAIGSWLCLYGCLLALQQPAATPAIPAAVTKWLSTLDPAVAAWLRR